MKHNGTSPEKKPRSRFSGFAVAATLWLWAILSLYAPAYLNIVRLWRIPFIVAGWVLLLIALLGTLIELSNIWKTRGVSYWAAGSVFLIPALILYVRLMYYLPVSWLAIVLSKFFVLFLTGIGGALIFQGAPYLLWKAGKEQKSQPPKMLSVDQKDAKRKELASILMLILMLVTVVIQLIRLFIPTQ